MAIPHIPNQPATNQPSLVCACGQPMAAQIIRSDGLVSVCSKHAMAYYALTVIAR